MTKLVRIQSWTIAGSVLILSVKAVAYFLTDSNAILSDLFESGVNVTAGLFALYSLILAAKPRDKNHPYGHGKIEFISASLEGSMIVFAGIIIIGKSIYNFINPYEVQELQLGIYLTGGAGLINFAMGGVLLYQGKKNHSMTMEADGKHLLSDAYSTVGMIIGLGIVYFSGLVWIDNLIAMVFGIIITITGIRILKKSLAGIMDEADTKLLNNIIKYINQHRKKNWIDLHNLRVIKYGSTLHLDSHMTLPWYYTNRQCHEELDHIEGLIKDKFGEQAEMFIHTDPCRDDSCSICDISDCDVRKNEFVKLLNWDVENTLEVEHHHL